MFCYCSLMTKPRRKSDIRRIAAVQDAELRKIATMKAAFLQPKTVSWHDRVLRALAEGKNQKQAADIAGISRSGIYWARQFELGFEEAYQKAAQQGDQVKAERRAAARYRPDQLNSFRRPSGPVQRIILTPGVCNFGLDLLNISRAGLQPSPASEKRLTRRHPTMRLDQSESQ
jgi:hypothetical protein